MAKVKEMKEELVGVLREEVEATMVPTCRHYTHNLRPDFIPFKHVIETERGLRRLTPIELERLNMFPDDHTKLNGITDAKRAFFMGNALVVGIIEKLGDSMMDKLKQ